jgi:hypothetical protein
MLVLDISRLFGIFSQQIMFNETFFVRKENVFEWVQRTHLNGGFL